MLNDKQTILYHLLLLVLCVRVSVGMCVWLGGGGRQTDRDIERQRETERDRNRDRERQREGGTQIKGVLFLAGTQQTRKYFDAKMAFNSRVHKENNAPMVFSDSQANTE